MTPQDLTQPLGEQLKQAESYLAFWQNRRFGKRHSRRPHRANWPLYLRALDAEAAGAGPTEMAATFWPDQQKQRSQSVDTLKLAKAVRDNFPLFV
jgi:hypothetical protein